MTLTITDHARQIIRRSHKGIGFTKSDRDSEADFDDIGSLI
jgi:hypothetical protein